MSNLSFEAKSGDQLEEVSLELASPQMVAFCSNDKGAVSAFGQLLQARGKILDGTVTVNGQDLRNFKHEMGQTVIKFADIEIKGRTVAKAIHKALRRESRALSEGQTLRMLDPLGINADKRVADLDPVQLQELKFIIMLAYRRRIVALDDALDKLSESARLTIGKLLKDYVQKTDSLILFTSNDVSTMMRFADTIYYFSGSRLTSVRPLRAGDGVDCTVTVTGTGFPVEMALRLGAHMLEESPDETRFLFSGNIQALLPLLEQSTITDVRIEDASVEDELMAY